jgi:serine/threonine protein kinase
MAVEVPLAKDRINIEAIGKYETVGILGKGGQSYVLDARDLSAREPCAIKVLFGYGDAAGAKEYVNAIKRLFSARKAFEDIGPHDHIVRFLDSGDLKIEDIIGGREVKVPCYFNVYEKVDLYDEKGGVPQGLAPWQVAGVGAEAASALTAMHEKGWVHRDVKPENLLLDKALHVHLGDFGVAYRLNRRTMADGKVGFIPGRPEGKEDETWSKEEAGCAIGTPYYMSPEQCIGMYAGPESDIYNLGAALYRMIAGRPPFEGRNPIEILTKASLEEATPLRKIRRTPRRISNIIMKMLEKKPEDRGDLRELEAELIKASTEPDEARRSIRNLWGFFGDASRKN